MYKYIMISCALFLLQGCASAPQVTWDYNPDIPTDTLQNYGWIHTKQSMKQSYTVIDGLDHDRIHNAINNILQQKGYQQTENKQADFLVHFFSGVKITKQVERITQPIGNNINYGCHHWNMGFITRDYKTKYRQKKIIIDILTNKNQLIWRGQGLFYIPSSDTPNERIKKINQLVFSILQHYPPIPKENK